MDTVKIQEVVRENHDIVLNLITHALSVGDVELIHEFLNNKTVVNEFANRDPDALYEIVSFIMGVERGMIALDNVDEIYDDLILQLIKAAKQMHLDLFEGQPHLNWALKERLNYKIIIGLVKAGSDVNSASDDTNETPLMCALNASYENSMEHKYTFDSGNEKNIIAELMNRGADINVRDFEGSTPLFYGMCYYYHNPDLIEMLLKAGSNVHDLDNEGKNILMIKYCCCLEERDCKAKESIDLLFKYGINDIDLKHADNNGNTILHLTYCKYLFDLAIKSGVSIEAKNNEGRTPLLKDRPRYSEKRVVHLLKSGANIHSTDPELQTVLHLCSLRIRFVYPGALYMLIYHGGDIYSRNINNETPLDIVIAQNYFYEAAYVIPKHIILFDDNGFDIGNEVLENLNYGADVSSFIATCKKELNLMRETFIAEGMTFYEFCILKRYYKSNCVNISSNDYKYSRFEISLLFPIYKNVIIIRM